MTTDHTHRTTLKKLQKCVKAVQSDKEFPSILTDVSRCTMAVSGSSDSRIDENAHSYLADNKIINWCRTVAPLYPIKICKYITVYGLNLIN